MKRILLATLILLVAGITVYAQQGGSSLPSSGETKQNAQQYLSQAKSNSSQFESTQADLNARNVGNKDLDTFTRLRTEIDRLESMIKIEQARIDANLGSGNKLDVELFNRVQRLIDQHKTKIAELEVFIAG